MLTLEHLNDPILKKLIRSVSPKDELFRQGDPGNTMYVILEGTVALLQKIRRTELRIATIGPGEIIGEKALMTPAPYLRRFSAIAESEAYMLELDSQSLKTVVKKFPELTQDALKQVTKRLDNTNELVSILMLRNECERLLHYLMYFYHNHSQKSLSAKPVSLCVEQIAQAANLDPVFVSACAAVLVSKKVLLPVEERFLISKADSLLQILPYLQERVA